jgi:magnesium-transporting ATPase (P-type)
LRQERLVLISSKEKEMSHRSVLHAISTVLFVFCTLSVMHGQGPQFVDQGWTSQDRQKFYTTTQGSQMMPMDWFMALEQSNGDPFTKDLTRYGFLPSSVNPNGLPVGFTLDSQAGKWAGLTCAACHTNQIEYNGKTWQLDGGPTDADLFTFLAQRPSRERSQTLPDSAGSPQKSGPPPQQRNKLCVTNSRAFPHISQPF